jgi:hypothetical protein
MLIDVRMGVDQAGRDDLARHVDDRAGDLRRDVGLDRDDAVGGHSHIGDAIAAGRRIDHTASAQQEIDLDVRRARRHGVILFATFAGSGA